MEVLISTFVLSVGLLGLASLLPLGRFAVVETNKADYSGACGRAAMRDVEIRRMLSPYDATGTGRWVDSGGDPAATADRCMTVGALAIDPLGMTSGATGDFGVLPRVNLVASGTGAAFTSAQAQEVFVWKDDIGYTAPDNARTYRHFYSDASGSSIVQTQTDWPVIEGNYSWLLTATPATAAASAGVPAAGRRLFKVSVAVCYRRDFAGEESVGVTQFVGGVGYGGGTILLENPLDVKADQWIFLCGRAGNKTPAQASWYRVVSVGKIGDAQALTLQGPDWNLAYHQRPAAVLIPTVLGVYTETIEVDNDPLWSY